MLLRKFGHGRTVRREATVSASATGRVALLRGEQLEDRCVPDTYTWSAAADGAANVAGNWTPNGLPGESDKIVFNNTSVKNCTMNLTKVQDVQIAVGYTGTMQIATAPSPFGAASTLEVKNTFEMTAPTATLTGEGISTLKFSGASYFKWYNGRIDGIDILLGSATDHAVTGLIQATSVYAQSTHLINYGSFTWVMGHIVVPNFTSQITNEVGGTFEVQASGYGFQSAQVRSAGEFTNRGLLKFNTDRVWISADFLNDGGTVRVYPGEVRFDYQAEQTSGTFELRGGTARVTHINHPLGIRNGLITGDGKVDGNLVLGYPGGSTAATIRPGIGDAVGTIDVTGQMHIFSSSAQTWIRILDDGSYSKIKVGSSAILGGVLWVENSPNYKPALGTLVNFLTAYGGLQGNFSHSDLAYWGCWMDPGGSGKPVKWALGSTDIDMYINVVPTPGS